MSKVGEFITEIFKCDRCGKEYSHKQKLQGISHRCMEREWDICDNCLIEFHNFMDSKKVKI